MKLFNLIFLSFIFLGCNHLDKIENRMINNQREYVSSLSNKTINTQVSLQDYPHDYLIDKCKVKDKTFIDKYFSSRYARFNKSANYWLQLGTCYLNSGDLFKARMYLKYSLKHKRMVKTLNNLAIVEQNLFHFDKAYKLIKSIIGRADKEKSTVRYNLSLLLIKMGYPKYGYRELKKITSAKNRELRELRELNELKSFVTLAGKVDKFSPSSLSSDKSQYLNSLYQLSNRNFIQAFKEIKKVKNKNTLLYKNLYSTIEENLGQSPKTSI